MLHKDCVPQAITVLSTLQRTNLMDWQVCQTNKHCHLHNNITSVTLISLDTYLIFFIMYQPNVNFLSPESSIILPIFIHDKLLP